MNITHAAIATVGAAGLAVTVFGAAPAQAAAGPTSARSTNVCEVKALSVKALNLQEDNQKDEIVLRLADTTTVERTYTKGQKRNTRADGSGVFSGNTTVQLLEVDALSSDVLASATLPCANNSGTSNLIDATGDAIYQVSWKVSIIA